MVSIIMDVTESINYEPEECAWWVGTRKGRVGERCPVCKGRGAVLVAQPPRMCVSCRGSAHEGAFSDRPACSVCGGPGWRGVYQPRV